jgi:tetratricopeptide (TPR) repeat protein
LAYVGKKSYPEAIREFDQALSLHRDNPTLGYFGALGHAHAVSGNDTQAREYLDRLRKMDRDSWVSPVHLARVHLGLGERDKAFEYLEKAFQRRDQLVLWIKVDPRFDPIRSDSRFVALLRGMKLE